MKTLYLHIGTTKTGTTSIQKFCLQNQNLLQEKNYCFPDSIHRYENRKNATFRYKGIHRNGHFLVGSVWDKNGRHNTAEEDRLFHEGMQNVASLFQTYDNIILSDEGIWYMSSYGKRDLWDKLKAHADAHGYQIMIIVYLRRQDDFLISNWNQAVKENCMTDSVEAHLEETLQTRVMRYSYGEKLDSIAQVFGKDHMIVRRFDSQSFYQGSIYADFLHCMQLELTDEYLPLKNTINNTSLEGNALEIMRILNTLPDLDAVQRLLCLRHLRKVTEISGSRFSMLSGEERREFMSHFEEGNRHVADEYIGDGAPLFETEPVELPKWEAVNPYMHEDLIRFFALESKARCEDIDALHQQIEALEQRLLQCEEKLLLTRNQLKHPLKTIGAKLFGRRKK